MNWTGWWRRWWWDRNWVDNRSGRICDPRLEATKRTHAVRHGAYQTIRLQNWVGAKCHVTLATFLGTFGVSSAEVVHRIWISVARDNLFLNTKGKLVYVWWNQLTFFNCRDFSWTYPYRRKVWTHGYAGGSCHQSTQDKYLQSPTKNCYLSYWAKTRRITKTFVKDAHTYRCGMHLWVSTKLLTQYFLKKGKKQR